MELTTVWFILIAVLWIGYFCLEGFDFGVGMLLPVLARDDRERRTMINTIGPVWDGNEVWVLTAGGATFAAFPEWYATLVQRLLPASAADPARPDRARSRVRVPPPAAGGRLGCVVGPRAVVGSVLPAILWGVAFANIVRGVPIDADKDFTGTLFTLLNPFGLLGGLVTLCLFLTHGAMFLALKTDGDIRHRARRLSVRFGLAAAVVCGRRSWSGRRSIAGDAGLGGPVRARRARAASAASAMAARGREGWAFIGTFV